MIDYVRIFSDSLGRMEAADPEKRDLIGCFYDQFLGSSEEIRRRFDATDLKHQEQMLRDSFKHVLTFSTKRRSNDELERIANRHSRSDLDVRPELYALWLDSLVESVRTLDPKCDARVETAWRIVMAPGIEFMKGHY